MSRTQIELEGTLQPDGTLVLDGKPELPPGRVQVVLRALPQSPRRPAESLVEFVHRVRRESEARGHRFMTGEEANAWIEELRADDDRAEQAYRDAEGERRRQGR
jgi:hypothetical protein